MILTIVRKEWLEARRDGRLWLAAGIVAVLLIAALSSGYRQVAAQTALQTAAQASERARWEDQDQKSPHSAAHYGLYAFRQPGPLAFFAPGLNSYLGTSILVSAHYRSEPQYRPARDSGPLENLGRLSPAAVSGLLLPLLIFVFAAPLVASERERGTLRQLLAQGVSARALLYGKWLAVLGLTALIIIPLLVTLVVLSQSSSAAPDPLLRSLLLGMALMLILAAMSALAIAVSALVSSTRSAVVILLGFWAITTLTAPKLAAEGLACLAPTPSAVEFRAALTADQNDRATQEAMKAQRFGELMQRYGVDSLDALPLGIDGVDLRVRDEHSYLVADRHFGPLFDTYAQHERVMRFAGWLSPGLAWNTASAGLAGTDFAHFRDFAEAVESYRRTLQNQMSQAMIDNPQPGGDRYEAGPELWSEVPEFRYSPPSFQTQWQSYWMVLLAPLLWLVLGLGLLEWATRRVARA